MSRKAETFTDLKGGERLYNLFKKKLEKAPPTNVIARQKPRNGLGMKTEVDEEEELCITIPLKGAKGGVSSSNISVHKSSSRFKYIN